MVEEDKFKCGDYAQEKKRGFCEGSQGCWLAKRGKSTMKVHGSMGHIRQTIERNEAPVALEK